MLSNHTYHLPTLIELEATGDQCNNKDTIMVFIHIHVKQDAVKTFEGLRKN